MEKLNFSALEKNLTDIIAEQQIKLGYRKEEVRLYYPKTSILNMLFEDCRHKDGDKNTKAAMVDGVDTALHSKAGDLHSEGDFEENFDNERLKRIITEYFNDKGTASLLSGIQVSCKEDRFCITISPNGSENVHERLLLENIPEIDFLKEFLSCVSSHHISLEDIKNVFVKYSESVICVETDIPDFDYLIYFEDGLPDAYMYCIKFEGEHAIYHRFTKKDYMDFKF